MDPSPISRLIIFASLILCIILVCISIPIFSLQARSLAQLVPWRHKTPVAMTIGYPPQNATVPYFPTRLVHTGNKASLASGVISTFISLVIISASLIIIKRGRAAPIKIAAKYLTAGTVALIVYAVATGMLLENEHHFGEGSDFTGGTNTSNYWEGTFGVEQWVCGKGQNIRNATINGSPNQEAVDGAKLFAKVCQQVVRLRSQYLGCFAVELFANSVVELRQNPDYCRLILKCTALHRRCCSYDYGGEGRQQVRRERSRHFYHGAKGGYQSGWEFLGLRIWLVARKSAAASKRKQQRMSKLCETRDANNVIS